MDAEDLAILIWRIIGTAVVILGSYYLISMLAHIILTTRGVGSHSGSGIKGILIIFDQPVLITVAGILIYKKSRALGIFVSDRL